MCSHSCSTGAGCDSDYSSVSLKKPKSQRVPKRGPGVAELEKILREQEKKDDVDRVKIEGFSSSLVSPFPNSYNPQHSNFLSSSNSLSGNVPFVTDRNRFSPPPSPPPPLPMSTSLYSNCVRPTNGNGNGSSNLLFEGGKMGGNVVQIGGSAMVSSEKALQSTKFASCETSTNDGEGSKMASGFPFSSLFSNGSNQNETFSSPPLLQSPLLQWKPCQYQSQMINLFPHSALPSLSTPSSAGLFHHVEPPSNQRSYRDYTSVWPDEEKITGAKRPRLFLMESTPAPPFQCQGSLFPSHIEKLDPSSSGVNSSKSNIGLTKMITSEGIPGSSLDLNSKRRSIDYGTHSGNSVTFASSKPPPSGDSISFDSTTIPSTSTQNFQQGFSKFSSFPFEYEPKESIGDSHQKSGSSASSVHKKPFYSFLPSEGKMHGEETTLSLSNERGGGRGDVIDLNLKL